MPNRLTIDEYAVQLALVASLRSEDPYVRVGACAFNHENRVIGLAYNGTAPGLSVGPEFWADREKRLPFMIHAEQNLCSLFKRGEARLVCTTIMPCSHCARMLVAYGVKKVVYSAPYHRDEGALEIFKFCNVEVQLLEVDYEIHPAFMKGFNAAPIGADYQ